MEPKKLFVLFFLAATMVAAGACGNDDDDDGAGGSTCESYCADADEIDCLGGMSIADCETFCEAFSDDEACGAEYEAMMQCYVDNGMECNGGLIESSGCEDEEDAYFDCSQE